MAHSEYLGAVMADGPAAFYPLTDGFASAGVLPQDFSGNGRHMTAATYIGNAAGPLGVNNVWLNGGQGMSRPAIGSDVDDLTHEGYFFVTAIGAANQFMMYNGNAAGGGHGVLCGFGGTNNTAYILLGTVIQLAAIGTMTASWKHIVVRRQAGTWHSFLDGVKSASHGTNAPTAPGVGGGNYSIGGSASLQFGAAYVAYYETALSDARVAAHLAAAAEPTLIPPARLLI